MIYSLSMYNIQPHIIHSKSYIDTFCSNISIIQFCWHDWPCDRHPPGWALVDLPYMLLYQMHASCASARQHFCIRDHMLLLLINIPTTRLTCFFLALCKLHKLGFLLCYKYEIMSKGDIDKPTCIVGQVTAKPQICHQCHYIYSCFGKYLDFLHTLLCWWIKNGFNKKNLIFHSKPNNPWWQIFIENLSNWPKTEISFTCCLTEAFRAFIPHLEKQLWQQIQLQVFLD